MEKQDKGKEKRGSLRNYACILITICLILLTISGICNSNSTGDDLQNLVTTPTTDQYIEVTRRAESSESSSTSETTSKPLLQQPGIQFALAFAGFIVLNMVAICIHHLYHIASRSTKSYRNVQQDISPF